MKDAQIAKELGYDQSKFAILKFHGKEKYDFIFTFDKEDRYKSVIKYIDYVKGLLLWTEAWYYEFESESDLGRWLIKNKVSNSIHPSIGSTFSGSLFRVNKDILGMKLIFVRKLEAIKKIVEKENNGKN